MDNINNLEIFDEKQTKVVNKIKHSNNSGQNTPLGTKPNDECYTTRQDILNELLPWGELGKFQGKNIICPCDWDIVAEENIYSIKITYKDNEVDVNGNAVKKIESVVCDMWETEDQSPLKLEIKENEIEEFLGKKLTCNFVKTLNSNARRWGIKSITASGYNPANGKGIRFQDVDYSQYDVCITNPPFSLYSEFMNCIVGKIDFIILAPFLNRANPNIGLPLMLKQAYFGFGAGIGNMSFDNPSIDNGMKKKTIAVDWIVSYPEAQEERNKELELKETGVNFETYKDEYIVMENMTMKDGTHPYRIPANYIPDDYYGWFFTSIQFLSGYDISKFEWYGTSFNKYFNTINPTANPFLHKVSSNMLDNPGRKRMFQGVVARRLKSEERGE